MYNGLFKILSCKIIDKTNILSQNVIL